MLESQKNYLKEKKGKIAIKMLDKRIRYVQFKISLQTVNDIFVLPHNICFRTLRVIFLQLFWSIARRRNLIRIYVI